MLAAAGAAESVVGAAVAGADSLVDVAGAAAAGGSSAANAGMIQAASSTATNINARFMDALMRVQPR